MKLRFRSYAVVLASSLELAACSDEGAPTEGRICPTCEPELGGDTGDFGGTPTLCGGYSSAEPVDVSQANALGFDVAELERRVARPIDMPLRWEARDTQGGAPATGYSSPTRVKASLSLQHAYRHVRPDPQYCDGTTCRFPGGTTLQATCPRRIEADVIARVETADGALKATLTGTAWMLIAGSEGEGASFANVAMVTTRAALSEATGTLRVAPNPGALGYRGWLQLELWLTETATQGNLSPNVMLQTGEASFLGYYPLNGDFPPREDPPAAQDAGASRR